MEEIPLSAGNYLKAGDVNVQLRANFGIATKTTRSLSVIATMALLLGLFGFGRVSAADTDSFSAQALVPDGKILATIPVQFDGVGSKELAIVISNEQRGLRLLVHKESTARNYEVTPAISIDLPTSVFAVQAVDLDSDGRTELALLGLETLHVVDWDEGGFGATAKEIARFERLFAIPRPDFVVEYEFLFDLNNDRSFDAILPCWDGIRVLKREKSGFAPVRLVKIEHGSTANLGKNLLSSGALCGLAITLPTLAASDLNTDRTKDIMVASGSGLAVCYQIGDMQFSEAPSQLLEVRPAFLDNLKFMSWGFGDLNNDKIVDYCLVFTQGDQDEFKTVLEIYLAGGQIGFAQRPSKRIVLDQYCLGLVVADLDDDGVASAILATVSVSPTSLVKSLLVKRMQVDLSVYQPQGGVLSEQPSSVKKVSCAIDYFSNGVPTRLVGCLHGDMDRDRMNDLVSLNDDDEIEVFKGAQNPQFSDKPILTRQAGRCTWLDAIDLNLDGKADLILHSVDETGRDVATLLWSK